MKDCTHPLLPTRQLVGLVLLIILCFSVSTVAEFTVAAQLQSWYAHVEKPAWYPPRGIFAPLWSACYLAMAVAAWLVWRCGGVRENRTSLALFATQLVLSLSWSLLFFGRQNPSAAFASSLLWWVAASTTACAFANRSRWAAALMMLCVAWISFIAVLTYSIWQLNEV